MADGCKIKFYLYSDNQKNNGVSGLSYSLILTFSHICKGYTYPSVSVLGNQWRTEGGGLGCSNPP